MGYLYEIKLANGDIITYESNKTLDELKQYIAENDFIKIPRNGTVLIKNGVRFVPKLASYQTKNITYIDHDIALEDYTKSELDQIDLAYALTTHLSQGSGYKTVIVIIDITHYTLLDTCLLYTAITRAKKRCLLVAEPSAFKKCLNTNKSIIRQTWLKDMTI